jgi:hypothetical protein
MRTSLIIGTLCVLGAGATGVGATFATQPFNGSDTLFNVTNRAMPAAGLGNNGDYVGGGSGAGENNMTSNPPKQWMAPMSKMMTSVTCGAFQGPTDASGVVIGLDGVDIYSSVFSGATAACSNQSTAGTNGLGLAYSTHLAYTDINGAAQTLTFKNWTDVLALLYGGLDKSLNNAGGSGTGYTDCNSPQRKALVANWSNLFEANGAAGSTGSSCSTNPSSACTTATYAAGSVTISINGQLRHAFRRDDASGTSDAFGSIIGLGTQFAVNTSGSGSVAGATLISTSVSGSKLNGFGVTDFCNAMNWDTTSANASCALGKNLQFIGPGGADLLVCSAGGALCAGTANAGDVCNSTGTCQWDGKHKRPPVNTWGYVSNVQAAKNIGMDVLPTAFQDNDPIRRQCIGSNNFIGSGTPAEEVCNLDNPIGAGAGGAGQLGLVLPMPEVDWLDQTGNTFCGGAACTAAAIYPTAPCTKFITAASGLINTFTCAPTNGKSTICPDGALAKGGCQVPATAANSSLCENSPSRWPTAKDTVKGDGRLFNLFAYPGTVTSSTAPIAYPIPGTTTSVPMLGMFTRLHMTTPIWDTAASPTPPTLPGGQAQGPCTATDMTDQIACLTQADPCSIGYAGDGGKLWNQHVTPALAVAGTDAMEVSQVYPTAAGVQSGTYPYWRKLYYNSSNGFDKVDGTLSYATSSNGGLSELGLGQFESNATSIDNLLLPLGFFGLGNSPNGGGNTPFCEDFNEAMLCGAASNANACANNTTGTISGHPSANSAITAGGVALSNFAPIPGDPSAVAASSTISTVCGNGKVETFEDCDWGIDPVNCSKTCRVNLP